MGSNKVKIFQSSDELRQNIKNLQDIINYESDRLGLEVITIISGRYGKYGKQSALGTYITKSPASIALSIQSIDSVRERLLQDFTESIKAMHPPMGFPPEMLIDELLQWMQSNDDSDTNT